MKHVLSGVAVLSLVACIDPFQVPVETVSSGLKPVLTFTGVEQETGALGYVVTFLLGDDDCLDLGEDARVTVNGTIQGLRMAGRSSELGCFGETWHFQVPVSDEAFTLEVADASGRASIRVANAGAERDYTVEGLEVGVAGHQYGVRSNSALTVHWPYAQDFALTGGAFNMELQMSDDRGNTRVKSFPATQVNLMEQTVLFNVPELPTDARSAALEVTLDASRIILACTGFTACDGESVPFASSTFQQVALLPAQ